jgi:hypothetical protein
MLLLAVGVHLAMVSSTPQPPYSDGVTSQMTHKACEWGEDASAQHMIGLGLAGGVDSPAQASPEACEKWCCETTHMKTVASTTGTAWQFTEVSGGAAARNCDIWQWKHNPTGPTWQRGCWVAGPKFVIGQLGACGGGCGKGTSKDTSWMGAQHCLDPGGSSGTGWLLVGIILGGGALYVSGGMALGRLNGRRGPLIHAHPHVRHWLELGALCRDGVAYVRESRGGAGAGSQARAARDKSSRGGAQERRGTKGKEEKKEKKEKKRREEGSRKPLMLEAAAAPQQTASTAAGSGGRWVHVSN